MPADTTREILANLRRREAELLAELEEVRRVIAAVEAVARIDTLIPGASRDTKESMRVDMIPGLRKKYSRTKAKAARVVKFIELCHKAGYNSMREACEAGGYQQGYVSQCLADRDAKRAPLKLRETFASLIGYPVDGWARQGD